MALKVIVVVLLLVAVSSVVFAWGRKPQRGYPKLQEDSALLKAQGKMPGHETVKAAERIFREMNFVGMKSGEVVDLLGQPAKKSPLKEKILWFYSFTDGERSVDQQIVFDALGERVTEVQ